MKLDFKTLVLSGGLFAALYPQLVFAEVVEKIEIEGNRRVEDSTIESYLRVKVGDNLAQEDMDISLKELFSTSFFQEVELALVDGVLKVKVRENPTISEIKFKGNAAVSNDLLNKAVPIKKGSVYEEAKINRAVQNLISYYQGSGRYNSRVSVETEYFDMNRVKLTFVISEGAVLKIKNIRFSGNRSFSDSDLRKKISIKEIAPFDFFGVGNRFDQYKMGDQARLIESFYRKEGFIDANVVSSVAHITADYRFAYIYFSIEEGDQYKVGDVRLESEVYGLYLGDLRKKALRVKPGKIFSLNEAKIEALKLNNEVIDSGEPFVMVEVKTNKNEDKKVVDITYLFKSTRPVYVEEINITGNETTRESVIRSMLTFQEGDPFNYKFLQESRTNIKGLSHISSVSVDYLPGSSPDQVKVSIEVKEKGSGYFFVAGGYSSVDGIVGQAMYQEGNFLGTDLDLSAKATFSKKKVDFDVGMSIPNFPWERTTLGFGAFSKRDSSKLQGAYSKSKIGGSVSFSYFLAKELAHTLGYTAALTELKRNSSVLVASSVRNALKDRLGKGAEIVLSSTLNYRPVFENFNWLVSISNSNSLVTTSMEKKVGQDSHFTEELELTHKWPIAKTGVILTTDLKFGLWQSLDSKKVYPDEGFFLGGENFLGFKYGGVGPRVTENNGRATEYIGSDTYITSKSQLSFQLLQNQALEVYALAFVTAGTSYLRNSSIPPSKLINSSEIRITSGVGFQWNSPVGPMQFTWSIPIKKNRYDKGEVFQFSVGRTL